MLHKFNSALHSRKVFFNLVVQIDSNIHTPIVVLLIPVGCTALELPLQKKMVGSSLQSQMPLTVTNKLFSSTQQDIYVYKFVNHYSCWCCVFTFHCLFCYLCSTGRIEVGFLFLWPLINLEFRSVQLHTCLYN